MLIQVVPYYPDLMRPAQRMNHHLCVAAKTPYVITWPTPGFDKVVKHYGR